MLYDYLIMASSNLGIIGFWCPAAPAYPLAHCGASSPRSSSSSLGKLTYQLQEACSFANKDAMNSRVPLLSQVRAQD